VFATARTRKSHQGSYRVTHTGGSLDVKLSSLRPVHARCNTVKRHNGLALLEKAREMLLRSYISMGITTYSILSYMFMGGLHMIPLIRNITIIWRKRQAHVNRRRRILNTNNRGYHPVNAKPRGPSYRLCYCSVTAPSHPAQRW
jgi:hypothetical protein